MQQQDKRFGNTAWDMMKVVERSNCFVEVVVAVGQLVLVLVNHTNS